MEAAARAMQRGLDLREGDRSRERSVGLIEMGLSLSLASPTYTLADPTITPATVNDQAHVITTQAQNVIPMSETATAPQAEEGRTRPEKKRKPEHMSPTCISLPTQDPISNLSFDSLSFAPGESRKTYQRRSIIRRKSLADITADGSQSGEGESSTPRAPAAGLKPPNNE
ncbi:unnamed protein product [Linum trigynum]|uniref:Uncharacterized protein n=1 Tax=Linum trigynum TaxID=586398 RepID=A0AAV2CR39_9ROSI